MAVTTNYKIVGKNGALTTIVGRGVVKSLAERVVTKVATMEQHNMKGKRMKNMRL